ncbi:MAG: trigger factor [candidate division WOR-3 bacterium]|nr:trigger factor [candidate division WOR-3 bacterium]
MEYQIVSETETEKEIEFKFGAQELEPYIDLSIERLRPKISIKGYRRGRAPKGLIRTRYYDALKVEALNDLIREAYKKVLTEKNWKPVSEPELVNFNDSGEIRFNLRFEVQPDFEVNDYRGLEIFKEEPLPLDYLYEQALNRLREDYADITETTKPAAVDDFITLDLEILEGDKIIEKQSEVVVKLGDRSFPDELNRALVGVKKGDRKEVHIDNHIYRIKIRKVEEKILPELNDNFARMLNYNNLEEMEKGLKSILEKEEEQRLKEGLEENLAQILLERYRFPVPKSLVEREYQMIIRSSKSIDNENNRERFLPVAEKRARLNLILEKIAQKENITVELEKVKEFALKNGLQYSEMDDDMVEYLRKMMVRNETLHFLLDNSKIIQKRRILSPEEARNVDRTIRH